MNSDYTFNVYRTEKYIVQQKIYLIDMTNGIAKVHSDDTYTLRTRKTNKAYMRLFGDREVVDGKRVHTDTYIRRYVD